jgi:hypothetical protein
MLGNGADILGGVAGLAGGCGAWPQLAGVAPSGRLATSISAALLIKAEEAADEELGAEALIFEGVSASVMGFLPLSLVESRNAT